jgi:hypothetical protein
MLGFARVGTKHLLGLHPGQQRTNHPEEHEHCCEQQTEGHAGHQRRFVDVQRNDAAQHGKHDHQRCELECLQPTDA